MSKSCGSCQYYTKMKDFSLCEFFDCRTTPDYGHNCKDYKALRYDRVDQKRKNRKEMEEGLE